MTALFVFGDARTETWGAGRLPAEGSTAAVALAAGRLAATLAVSVTGAPSEEGYQLSADGLALTLQPGRPGLCRASGCFTLAGRRHRLDCPGWIETDEPYAGADWESLRWVSVWFSFEEGVVLSALRPPEAAAHGEDLISARIVGLEPEGEQVEDPRLSTTYDRAGGVIRAGLELWLDAPEGEEHRVLRAAGEGVGVAGGWQEQGASFTGRLVRWHCRGREGTGVYLLGRRL